MKSFKEYLTESAKRYDFRIKLACECSTEHETKLKTMLERFSVAEFKKVGKTPIQELPLDFPKLKNREVTVYEVSLEYPTTQFELTEYISSGLGMTNEELAVRSPNEPTEAYQQPVEKREGALLDDPNYKEAANAKFEDYYGEKYNASFLQSLNNDAKERRKERGEQVPTTTEAKFSTDKEEAQTSLFRHEASRDPRKK